MSEDADFAARRKAAYAKLDEAIEELFALFVSEEAEREDYEPVGEVATDAVLVIGSQFYDNDGHRSGCVTIAPRQGWQPGYITAGLLTMALARVTD